jgi:hypothetical protein
LFHLSFEGFKELFLGDEAFFNSYDSGPFVMNFYGYARVILRIKCFGEWARL